MFLFSGNTLALDADNLDRFLQAQVETTKIPGLVAIVVDKDSVLYHAAFGKQDVANDIPMSRDTLFRIASMTKPVAATAVMMLVERRELGLDDPVAKYLPELAGMDILIGSVGEEGSAAGRPAKTELTFRHLLSHSSGLAYGFSNEQVFKMVQGEPFADNSNHFLLYDPGTSWSYGTGIAKATSVLEQLTGKSLDEFLASELFGPLQMNDTGYSIPPEKYSRITTSHQLTESGLEEKPVPEQVPEVVSGDYGLWSTAADYARFVQMFLNDGKSAEGTRILAEKTVDLIGQNQLVGTKVTLQKPPMPMKALPFPLGADRDGFGLGFQITGDHSDDQIRAPGSMSWSGLVNTQFWIDRQSGIGAVLLMQYLPFYDGDAIATLKGFENLVYASEPRTDSN